MNRRLLAGLIVVAAAAVVLQLVTDYVNTWPGPPPLPIFVVTTTVVGVSYLAAGIIAWCRRPTQRIGLVFLIVGLVWYLPALTHIRSPVPFTLGNLLGGLYTGALAHLALAWPSGYLRSKAQRLVVGSNYVWIVVGSIVGTLFWDPRTNGCSAACPANAILLDSSNHVLDVVNEATTSVGFAFTVVVVALIVRNWRSAQGYARREMNPLLWVATPVAAYVVVQNVVENLNVSASDLVVYGIAPLVLVLPPCAFLAGMLRARLARRAVGSALIALEPGPPPERLRETLAAVLGDSTLLLAFRRPSGSYLDTREQEVDIVGLGPSRVVTGLDPAGEAVLVYDERLQYEPGLVKVAVAVASLALQHARLRAEVTAQLDQVRASRARIVEAGDTARRRLERDLHDGAQQRLVTLSLALGMARERAGRIDPELGGLLETASREARAALVELRELARGIHPAVLTETGLRGALQALVERAPIVTQLGDVTEERFPAPIEATAYFVVAEALTNVAKHAAARSAAVFVTRSPGVLTVGVCDDGTGGARPEAGSGLRGLVDRVASVGGVVHIDSPPGRGTRIGVEIPCP